MGFFLAFISSLATLVGDITAKLWVQKNQTWLFVVTLAFYMVSSVAFPLALRFGKLTIINAFASVTIVILVSLAGVFMFKEKITGWQLAGLILGILAIALLAFGERGWKE